MTRPTLMTDAEFRQAYQDVTPEQLDCFRVWVYHTAYAAYARHNPTMRNDVLFVQSLMDSVQPIQRPDLAYAWIKTMLKGDIDETLRKIIPEQMATWDRRKVDREDMARAKWNRFGPEKKEIGDAE